MESILLDLRYGLRMLKVKPIYTLVAILALALGIGATSAVFSVVNTVVLRPLPFKDQDRLVMLWENNVQSGQTEVELSYPNFDDWHKQNTVFEDMAALPSVNLDLTMLGLGEPQHVQGCFASPSFFTMLGANAHLGRVFTADDDKPDAHYSVISYGLWQRSFGGDNSVIGKQIIIDGEATSIVGVMPKEFNFPGDIDVWGMLTNSAGWMAQRDFRVLRAVGRLKPGISFTQAQTEMNGLAARLATAYPKENSGFGVTLIPLTKTIFGNTRTALFVMLAAVILVLLIACANVANLLLAGATVRQREIAIRLALGATRWRLVRQLLTEGLLLAILGGGAGLLLAWWGIGTLIALAPADLPRISAVTIDRTAVIFTFAITFLTTVVFGLAPALQASKPDLNEALKEGINKMSGSARTNRLRNILVVSEVALAVLLMISAGLLIRSFNQLQSLDPGFTADRIFTARVALNQSKYTSKDQYRKFFRELVSRVENLPGAESGAAILLRPLSGVVGWDAKFAIEGQNEAEWNSNPYANFETISNNYFRTMSIALISGREFTDQDNETVPGVVIINETMAHKYWPNQDAVGKRMKLNGSDAKAPWFTVVGVVKDVRYREWETIRPDIYMPFTQRPQYRMDFVVRAKADATSVAAAFRQAVYQLDREQAVSLETSLDNLVSRTLAPPKFNMVLIALFAILALLLSMVGVYGVISYTVSQRTHEMGIRIALGAQTSDLIRLVVWQGFKPVLIGLILGTAGALAFTRIMTSLLFGISAADPITYIVITTILAAVSLVAAYLPAQRATKVDPLVALRYE